MFQRKHPMAYLFVRSSLRGLGLLLALLLVGEFVLTLAGWRHRSVPYLLRAQSETRAEDPLESPADSAAGRPVGAPSKSTDEEFGRLIFHPTRLFTLAPNHARSSTSRGRQATGAWPFRGRPATPEPKDLVRVVLVGDSRAYGSQLFERDCLATSLGEELSRRGFGPDLIAVVGMGVPGYTTLQIERLVREEVFNDRAPAVVVLATSLWSDRVPATNPVHQSSILEAAQPSFFGRAFAGWKACLNWMGWGGNPLRQFAAPQEVEAASRAGDPLFGPTVSREETALAVHRTITEITASAKAGAAPQVVAILPAYPFQSLGRQQGLVEDVVALGQAFDNSGADVVNGSELLARSGLTDAQAFLDEVHPSGLWNAVLADAIADKIEGGLRQRIDAAERMPVKLSIQAISPMVVSALGDQEVQVQVRGLPSGELPVVLIGGQPLYALERVDDLDGSTLKGFSGADRPGRYDLVVQSSVGVVTRPLALQRKAPQLEYVPGDQGRFPRLVLASRPGDRIAELFAANSLAPEPKWSVDGDILLDGKVLPVSILNTPCDASGRAELLLEVPASWPSHQTFLQALVLPPGEEQAGGVGVISDALLVPANRDASAQPGRNSTSDSALPFSSIKPSFSEVAEDANNDK